MVLVMMSVSLVLDHTGDCCYQDGLVVAMQESCNKSNCRAGFVGSAKEVARMADPYGSPRSGPLERFLIQY
jgi:hypothetical protein